MALICMMKEKIGMIINNKITIDRSVRKELKRILHNAIYIYIFSIMVNILAVIISESLHIFFDDATIIVGMMEVYVGWEVFILFIFCALWSFMEYFQWSRKRTHVLKHNDGIFVAIIHMPFIILSVLSVIIISKIISSYVYEFSIFNDDDVVVLLTILFLFSTLIAHSVLVVRNWQPKEISRNSEDRNS